MPLPSCFENTYPHFLIHTTCSTASQFSQVCKHSNSLISFGNRCILILVRFPRSKTVSCKHELFYLWKPCIKKITSPGKSQETKNFPRFHSCESIDADTYAVYTAGDNANQRAMLLYSHSQLPDALPVSLHEAGFQPGPALSDISCDSTLSVQSLFEAFFIV